MSDRTGQNDTPGGDRLFKQMDEQERIYAPQQVPGGVDGPAEEVDTAGSAGAGTGQRDGADVGVVPVRPDTSINAPIPVPIIRHDHDGSNEGEQDTTQGLG